MISWLDLLNYNQKMKMKLLNSTTKQMSYNNYANSNKMIKKIQISSYIFYRILLNKNNQSKQNKKKV